MLKIMLININDATVHVEQRLSNNMPVYFAYYAGIMLDAFGYLLCFYYAEIASIIGLGLVAT